MENKLTWVELKKKVVRQTNLTEKEVNTILTTWLDEMTAALKRGEELHINGFGTFKTKTMKARKSVDVTTGQAILLPETERLTFTMASALEQELSDNAPTRLEVNKDPIKKLSDQADEIMDIIGEIKGMEGEKAKGQEGEKAKVQEGEKARGQEGEKAKGEKKERLWLTAGITIVAFLALLIGLFFFLQHRVELWLTNLREQVETEEVVETTDNLDNLDTLDNLETLETLDNLEIANYREYTEFIAEERMHQDSRLAWMAYRYYGNKKLWVFIYDANKDHINNPESIQVGTLIRVPKLSQDILSFGEDIQTLVEEMYKEFIGER